MKRILSILSTFLFALVLTLTSCTKENLRTSNECDICGTWKFDSIVVPSQVNSCGITTDYDNSPLLLIMITVLSPHILEILRINLVIYTKFIQTQEILQLHIT